MPLAQLRCCSAIFRRLASDRIEKDFSIRIFVQRSAMLKDEKSKIVGEIMQPILENLEGQPIEQARLRAAMGFSRQWAHRLMLGKLN